MIVRDTSAMTPGSKTAAEYLTQQEKMTAKQVTATRPVTPYSFAFLFMIPTPDSIGIFPTQDAVHYFFHLTRAVTLIHCRRPRALLMPVFRTGSVS